MVASSDSESVLFRPAKVGDITTSHRVVLAPLSRTRANDRHVHTDLAVTYYTQRGSVPGTLLITEATYVAPYAGHYSPHNPGVWDEEQTEAWKRVSHHGIQSRVSDPCTYILVHVFDSDPQVADAVHAKGSFIFMQLWALGRSAVFEALKAENPDYPYVSSSDIPLGDRDPAIKPRPLTVPEIKAYIAAFAQAARNAVYGAGCDGVEIHCAHGYLIDQFIQDTCNMRTDEYGGSIENRCRFALEIIDAVAAAVGESKVGFRISPWNAYQDMRMADPIPTFSYLVSQAAQRHPNLAYLHVVDPGVDGSSNVVVKEGESNDFLRKIWAPRPYISAGRYTRETAMKRADETGELIAFGRRFISNPDLPYRLRKNIPLNGWDREIYNKPADAHGYIDYPFAGEEFVSPDLNVEI